MERTAGLGWWNIFCLLSQQNNGKTMVLHAMATHFKYGIQRPPWQTHELSSLISLSFLDVYGSLELRELFFECQHWLNFFEKGISETDLTKEMGKHHFFFAKSPLRFEKIETTYKARLQLCYYRPYIQEMYDFPTDTFKLQHNLQSKI